MNRAELIKEVSEETGISREKTELIITRSLDKIKNKVASGENVKLRGFGTFSQIIRNEWNTTCPKTGLRIQIPQKKWPKFSPSQYFKQAVK